MKNDLHKPCGCGKKHPNLEPHPTVIGPFDVKLDAFLERMNVCTEVLNRLGDTISNALESISSIEEKVEKLEEQIKDIETGGESGNFVTKSEFDETVKKIEDEISNIGTGGVTGDYVTKEELDSILSGYATDSDLSNYAKTSDLSGYAKESELSGYTTTTDFDSAVSDLQKQIDSLESGGADLTNYYTKSETDSLLGGYAKESELSNYATSDSLESAVSKLEEEIAGIESGGSCGCEDITPDDVDNVWGSIEGTEVEYATKDELSQTTNDLREEISYSTANLKDEVMNKFEDYLPLTGGTVIGDVIYENPKAADDSETFVVLDSERRLCTMEGGGGGGCDCDDITADEVKTAWNSVN